MESIFAMGRVLSALTSPHFAIKGINTLLVKQSELPSTVLLGLGDSIDAQLQGASMSRAWGCLVPSTCLTHGVLPEALRYRHYLSFPCLLAFWLSHQDSPPAPDLSKWQIRLRL